MLGTLQFLLSIDLSDMETQTNKQTNKTATKIHLFRKKISFMQYRNIDNEYQF